MNVVFIYAFGFVFSTIGGHLLISPLMRRLWKACEEELRDVYKVQSKHGLHPRMLGMLERAMYTSAWLLGLPQFITIWLGIKTVGQWGTAVGGSGRLVFNLFLIGNAFSIAFGAMGGLTIKWMLSGRERLALLTAVGLAAANLAAYFWVRWTYKAKRIG